MEELIEEAMDLIETRRFSGFLYALAKRCLEDRSVLKKGGDRSPEAAKYLQDEEITLSCSASLFEQLENKYEELEKRARSGDRNL